MKRSDLLKSIVVANLLVSQLATASDKQDPRPVQPDNSIVFSDLEEITNSTVPQHNGVCSNKSC